MLERKQLLNALGTYWSRNFSDDPFLNGLLEGQLALQAQVETNWEELALSAYRKHIPLYHTELVYTFNLEPANKNATEAALPKFGDKNTLFQNPGVNPNWITVADKYGEPSAAGNWYQLPLTDVVSIEKIVDNPVNPTVTFLPDIDFTLENDAVNFVTDPCLGNNSKEYFLINTKQDFQWIYKHFGVILQLEASSSELYRKIVDDIFGAYITGAPATDVFSILASVTGNIVSKDKEIVLEVTDTQIITDKNTYTLTKGHTPKVIPGDKIEPGDSLTKEFNILHINQLAYRHELEAILIPKRFLGPKYFYGVVFINQDMPLHTINGQKRFFLGGNLHDVALFWEDFEKHCERHNTTVNEVIDLCTISGTINPYRFFTEHIGRYNYTLIEIDHVKPPTELSVDNIPIRNLTPPSSTLIIQQKLKLEQTLSPTGASGDTIHFNIASLMAGHYNVSPISNIYITQI